MKPKTFAILALMLLLPTTALADCYYNGKRYGEGERVGQFTCQSGRWVRDR
jgi:hypothetical protein